MKFYRNMSPEERGSFKFVVVTFLAGVLTMLAVPFLFWLWG